MSTNDTTGSPVPGIIPEPVRVEHDEPAVERPAGGTPAGDPGAEREARREASEARREPPAARSGVTIPNRRKRLPFEAPLMRGVATAGIVGIAIAIAAIMSSQIGLVASIASLLLAAVLWSSAGCRSRPGCRAGSLPRGRCPTTGGPTPSPRGRAAC